MAAECAGCAGKTEKDESLCKYCFDSLKKQRLSATHHNSARQEAFRAARKEAGLTQADLGKIMGISQSRVADLESGYRRVSKKDLAFAQYIAQTLNSM